MSVINTIIGIVVGGFVVASVGKIYYEIYKAIKKHNLYDTKYEVSFKKHFKKVKVPLIKMKIAGELRYFVVDSGADNSVLSKTFYDSVDPKNFTDVNYSMKIITPNGETEERPFVEADLSFKKDVFEDIPFLVSDLTSVENHIKSISNIVIAGILGSSFFNKYKWAIDFDERCIWVNPLEAVQENE